MKAIHYISHKTGRIYITLRNICEEIVVDENNAWVLHQRIKYIVDGTMHKF